MSAAKKKAKPSTLGLSAVIAAARAAGAEVTVSVVQEPKPMAPAIAHLVSTLPAWHNALAILQQHDEQAETRRAELLATVNDKAERIIAAAAAAQIETFSVGSRVYTADGYSLSSAVKFRECVAIGGSA